VIAWMTIYTLKISTLNKNKHRVLRFCFSAGILAAVSAIIAFHKV
jgi:phosphate starvation-inducible membrane PsiE